MLFTLYYQGFKASNISVCLYKICDDSIRLRHFLDIDNKDEIEVILSKREGYFLYEFIDENKSLYPIIDFDLSIEILNAITPKLSYSQVKNLLCHAFRDIYLEVFSKQNKKTIIIAESSDINKISLHVSIFDMRTSKYCSGHDVH